MLDVLFLTAFGFIILVIGFAASIFFIILGLSCIICERKKREVGLGLICFLFLITSVCVYWPITQLDQIANSPEADSVGEGATFYSVMEGYPITETIPSILGLPESLVEYINALIPSEYHWTIFRFKALRYATYVGIARGDFEGENCYRVHVSKIHIYELHIYDVFTTAFTIMEFDKVEETNIFEASAYLIGRVPFGNIIYKLLSITFLISIPLLGVGGTRSFIIKKEARKEQVSLIRKTRVPEIPKQTITYPYIPISQIYKEVEELKVRHELGEIHFDTFKAKSQHFVNILVTRKRDLVQDQEILKKRKEELKARMLVGELSVDTYQGEIRAIDVELQRISDELNRLKKSLSQIPK